MRLLIAESNPMLAIYLQRYFSGRGYEVETASGGVQCLERLRRFLPQVLLLSENLFWGGSEGVLAQLREEFDAPKIPVVLVGPGGCGQESEDDLEPPVVRRFQNAHSLEALHDGIRSAVTKRKLAPGHSHRIGALEP